LSGCLAQALGVTVIAIAVAIALTGIL
jgi:hypothetical protein